VQRVNGLGHPLNNIWCRLGCAHLAVRILNSPYRSTFVGGVVVDEISAKLVEIYWKRSKGGVQRKRSCEIVAKRLVVASLRKEIICLVDGLVARRDSGGIVTSYSKKVVCQVDDLGAVWDTGDREVLVNVEHACSEE
jgi:hypothetical protein